MRNLITAPRTTRIALALAALAAIVRPALAQSPASQAPAVPEGAFEFRVASGELVPTGNLRSLVQNAQLSAAQLSWHARPHLAVTGTFGWARSRDLVTANRPKLDVFTSDVGVEARASTWFAGRAVTFSPFVGGGAGARSYNYRTLDVDATHNVAAYGAVGGEVGVRRIGVRLEVRDYATGFKPLVGAGRTDARNDVVIMAALRIKRHAASQE